MPLGTVGFNAVPWYDHRFTTCHQPMTKLPSGHCAVYSTGLTVDEANSIMSLFVRYGDVHVSTAVEGSHSSVILLLQPLL